jgi:hypothetical protein
MVTEKDYENISSFLPLVTKYYTRVTEDIYSLSKLDRKKAKLNIYIAISEP